MNPRKSRHGTELCEMLASQMPDGTGFVMLMIPKGTCTAALLTNMGEPTAKSIIMGMGREIMMDHFRQMGINLPDPNEMAARIAEDIMIGPEDIKPKK